MDQIQEINELLGAMKNPYSMYEITVPCSGTTLVEDDWRSTLLRTTSIQTKEETSAALKAKVESELKASLLAKGVDVSIGLQAAISAAAAKTTSDALKLQNTIYTLKPASIQKRRKACGPDTPKRRLVVSAAIIEISAQNKSTTLTSVDAALNADGRVKQALETKLGNAEASVALTTIVASITQVIKDTVVGTQRFPIAVGYESDAQLVDAAPSMTSRLKCIEAALRQPKLECESSSVASPVATYAGATAEIPKPKIEAGFVRISGGCLATDSSMTGGHNAILVRSSPAGVNGWECKIADPPNTPVARAVTAYVVYCRAEPAFCDRSSDGGTL